MSQDGFQLTAPKAFQLRRLDLIVAELARPVLDTDAIGPSTRERLSGLGIAMGGAPCRKKLIERVWDRKRELMHGMRAADDWGLLPPGA